MESQERQDESFATTTTASSSQTTNNSPGVPKRSLLDDSAATGTSSARQLSDSVLQEARAKILQAKEDRKQSKLPKRLIPLVEMCLPPGYRLSTFEEDAQRTYQKVFGSCSSSACLGHVDMGHVDRKDNDGALFEDAEER